MIYFLFWTENNLNLLSFRTFLQTTNIASYVSDYETLRERRGEGVYLCVFVDSVTETEMFQCLLSLSVWRFGLCTNLKYNSIVK